MLIEINLPTATEAHRYASQCSAEIAQQQERHRLAMVSKGVESFPKLVGWLTQLIQDHSSKGCFNLQCDLVDTRFLENHNFYVDTRIDYRFDGYFTREMGDQLEKLFKLAGYSVSVWCYNVSTYRTAEITIHW